jgi:hypothetical protein
MWRRGAQAVARRPSRRDKNYCGRAPLDVVVTSRQPTDTLGVRVRSGFAQPFMCGTRATTLSLLGDRGR